MPHLMNLLGFLNDLRKKEEIIKVTFLDLKFRSLLKAQLVQFGSLRIGEFQ